MLRMLGSPVPRRPDSVIYIRGRGRIGDLSPFWQRHLADAKLISPFFRVIAAHAGFIARPRIIHRDNEVKPRARARARVPGGPGVALHDITPCRTQLTDYVGITLDQNFSTR